MLIRSRRKSSGIDRGYADPVIVHEYVPENDALHLIPRQFVRGDPVDFFLLQGCKKAFHSRIVKAISGTAEALNKSCIPERSPECLAGVLTSPPVSVKDRSADFFRIAIQAPSRFGCRVPSSILLSIATVVMTLRGSGEGLKNTQKINAECCKLLRFSGKCVIILPTVRDGGFRFRSSARPEQG